MSPGLSVPTSVEDITDRPTDRQNIITGGELSRERKETHKLGPITRRGHYTGVARRRRQDQHDRNATTRSVPRQNDPRIKAQNNVFPRREERQFLAFLSSL